MSFRRSHTAGHGDIPAWFPSRQEVNPASLSLEGRIVAIARENGVRLKSSALTPDEVASAVTVFEQTGQVLTSWSREALRLYARIPEIRSLIRAKAEAALATAPQQDPPPVAPSPAVTSLPPPAPPPASPPPAPVIIMETEADAPDAQLLPVPAAVVAEEEVPTAEEHHTVERAWGMTDIDAAVREIISSPGEPGARREELEQLLGLLESLSHEVRSCIAGITVPRADPPTADRDEPIDRASPKPLRTDLAALERKLNLPPFREGHRRRLSLEQIRAGVELIEYLRSRRDGSNAAFLSEHHLAASTHAQWKRRLELGDEEVDEGVTEEVSADESASRPEPVQPGPTVHERPTITPDQELDSLRRQLNLPMRVGGVTLRVPDDQKKIVLKIARILGAIAPLEQQEFLRRNGLKRSRLAMWEEDLGSPIIQSILPATPPVRVSSTPAALAAPPPADAAEPESQLVEQPEADRHEECSPSPDGSVTPRADDHESAPPPALPKPDRPAARPRRSAPSGAPAPEPSAPQPDPEAEALERELALSPFEEGRKRRLSHKQLQIAVQLMDHLIKKDDGSYEAFLRRHRLSSSMYGRWVQRLAQCPEPATPAPDAGQAGKQRRSPKQTVRQAQNGRRTNGRQKPRPPRSEDSSAFLPPAHSFNVPTLDELAQWEREQGVERPITRAARMAILMEGIAIEKTGDASAFERFLKAYDLRHHEFNRWRRMHAVLLLQMHPTGVRRSVPAGARDGDSFDDEGVIGDGDGFAAEDAEEEDDAGEDDGEGGEWQAEQSATPFSSISDVLLSEASHASAYEALFCDDGQSGQRETIRAGILSAFAQDGAVSHELAMLRSIPYAQRTAVMHEQLATLLLQERGLSEGPDSREYALLVQIPEEERNLEQQSRLAKLACELFACVDEGVGFPIPRQQDAFR